MQRLAPSDSLFLSLETSRLPLHVGGLVTVDTTEAPDFGFDRVREMYARRLARAPKLSWRLAQVPWGLDRPLWTDGEFDIDAHIERVMVPSPGGPREVAEVVGRLFSQPLPRDVPLWRMWYLDGLPEGTAAMFSTHHHCLMDGASGANLSGIMFDLEPDAELEPPQPLEGPGGRELSELEQVIRGGLSLLATPAKLPGFLGGLVKRVVGMVPDIVRHGVPSPLQSIPPRTSFNGIVGERRMLAFSSLSVDDMKAIRKRLGVTVNDVIVAVCADALERYLHAVGEPVPDRPFSIAVPVSMRPPGDDGELTNRVSAFPISVVTDPEGPVQRVNAVARETERGKRLATTFAMNRLPSLGELMVPGAWSVAARAMTPLFPLMPVFMNTMVSTVRGPEVPFYVCGARVTGIYPTSVVLANMGVNFTAMSSSGRVDVGITVDPELVPDPWIIADALPDALADLMRAAGLGDAHPVPRFAVGRHREAS